MPRRLRVCKSSTVFGKSDTAMLSILEDHEFLLRVGGKGLEIRLECRKLGFRV